LSAVCADATGQHGASGGHEGELRAGGPPGVLLARTAPPGAPPPPLLVHPQKSSLRL